jgi:Protein of unknown function (DUF998)
MQKRCDEGKDQMTQSLAANRLTRALLGAGIAAGPFYMIVGVVQAFSREGFDVRRHALSLLSNGSLGWIQIANFLISGLLVIGGALGVRRALSGGRGGTWGPILLGVYGVGLIGAGIFVADPGLGFPPGTPMNGILHFVFGGIGFYGLIAGCFVFGWLFQKSGRPGWAVYSLLSGLIFFVSFAAIASGSKGPATILGFYGAVAWIWLWHSAVLMRLLCDLRRFDVENP